MRVYFHRVVISPFKGITRSTCFVLRAKNKNYLCYSLLLCNLDSTIDYAQSISKGSTMPYAVWENGLGNMKVIIPSIKKLRNFEEIVYPIISRIRDKFFENQKLTELRDSLLPKLMNGEIRVKV